MLVNHKRWSIKWKTIIKWKNQKFLIFINQNDNTHTNNSLMILFDRLQAPLWNVCKQSNEKQSSNEKIKIFLVFINQNDNTHNTYNFLMILFDRLQAPLWNICKQSNEKQSSNEKIKSFWFSSIRMTPRIHITFWWFYLIISRRLYEMYVNIIRYILCKYNKNNNNMFLY